MKITQTCYLYCKPHCYKTDEIVFQIHSSSGMEEYIKELTPLGSREVTFDIESVPDTVSLQIDIIRRQQTEALELFQKTSAELNERLMKLQALSNEAAA